MPQGFRVGKNAFFWVPHPRETRECCTDLSGHVQGIFRWPYTYYKHCCTIRHVAMLVGVEERELARVTGKRKKEPNRCAQCHLFRKDDDYLCGSCRNTLEEAISSE